MDLYVLIIVASLATITLLGMLWKMNRGIGPFNLRAFGILLLTTFAVLLALVKPTVQSAAIALLGAIAGYLFSFKDPREKEETSSVGIDSSTVGPNARIAGRDINETIENMRAELAEIRGSVVNQYQILQETIGEQHQVGPIAASDYLINVVFERGEQIREAIDSVLKRWEPDGWRLASLSSDYNGTDGVMLLFKRPSRLENSRVVYFAGVPKD